MIIVDTHAWAWWTSGDARLSAGAQRAMDDSESIGVCAISCYELALLESKGRVALLPDASTWMHRAFTNPALHLVPLTPAIAVRATRLGPSFHKDPADRIIVASALELGCPVVSADRLIRHSGVVETIW